MGFLMLRRSTFEPRKANCLKHGTLSAHTQLFFILLCNKKVAYENPILEIPAQDLPERSIQK